MNVPQTPEQRLAGVIGQIIVENSKLGYEIEVTRLQVQEANERANTLSVELQQARDQTAQEKARADGLQIEVAGLEALVRKLQPPQEPVLELALVAE